MEPSPIFKFIMLILIPTYLWIRSTFISNHSTTATISSFGQVSSSIFLCFLQLIPDPSKDLCNANVYCCTFITGFHCYSTSRGYLDSLRVPNKTKTQPKSTSSQSASQPRSRSQSIRSQSTRSQSASQPRFRSQSAR